MATYDRLDLLNTLTEKFNESELEDLCFALHVDHQLLDGTNKRGKARSLILFMEQRNRMDDLFAACKNIRDDVALVATTAPTPLPDLPDSFVQTIPRTAPEKLLLLRRAITLKLLSMGFPRPVIADFEYCYGELTDNGIEHGCETDNDAIQVEADVNDLYVTLSVKNLSSVLFDPIALIEQQRATLSADPMSRRGRGLISVADLADSINGINNRAGVKIVMYADPARFQVCKLDGVTIIEVMSGLTNPAINNRMTAEVSKHTTGALILHVPRRDPQIEDAAEHSRHGTKVLTRWVDLYNAFKDSARMLAVYIATGDAGELNLLFPPNFIAGS